VPSPAPAPPSAPAAGDPLAAPADHASDGEGKIRSERRHTDTRRESPDDERSSGRQRTVAEVEPGAGAGSKEVPAVVAPSSGAAVDAAPPSEVPAVAEPTPPPRKLADIAIKVRPMLGTKAPAFQIVRMVALIDTKEIVAIDDKTFWQGKQEIDLWKGRLPVGDHVLNVVVDYHGNGHSVFSYFDSYHYATHSSTQFQLQEGARLEMMIDIVDKGGVNTAFDKRLQIAFAPR
jgi:hypothetical protein